MSMLQLPEVLNHFNVYEDGDVLVGQDADIELPEFTAITDTLSGSGILGEIEDPVTGQYESATMTIKWAVINKDYFRIIDPTRPKTMTSRGSVQMMDTSTGETDYKPIKIVVRGKAKNIALGKFEKGKKMENEVEIEIMYIKVTSDKTTLLELDKLNFKFVLNGEDKLAKIRAQV